MFKSITHTLTSRLLLAAAFSLFGSAAFFAAASPAVAATPAFTEIVVFGDSLSDDGNLAHRTQSDFDVSYPGSNFNYSDHRFTDSSDTDPASKLFAGTWHEQLATTFLKLPVATDSQDGGTDYAFGGATTADGTSERTVISNPEPFAGGSLTVTIDNMGKQVDDYLGSVTPSATALYVLWGGGNDLFDDDSSTNVTAAVAHVSTLVEKLAKAGARNFLVANVPPLGAIPHYNGSDDTTKATQLDVASSSFRTQLSAALAASKASLATQGITIQLYPLDIWSLVIRLTAEPAKYGFTNVTDSAQGDSSVDPDKYLFWDDIHPTTAGHYQIAFEANQVLSGAEQPQGKAENISTRANIGTGANVAIAGFIVTGTATKDVILRGLGPSLTASGVQGALPDPTLSLYDQSGHLLATNNNWKDTQQAQIEATGIPPQNDLESAIVTSLPPGTYTAQLSGQGGVTGIGVVEVYDLNPAVDSMLGNISTRAVAGTDQDVIIGGFIVGNGDSPLVEVRALGPSLTAAGVANALQDPVLALHDANGALIASNDDWKATQESALRATGIAPTNEKESAIIASLAPGNYTAIVRGQNNTTGVALVEAYRLQ